MANSFRVMWLKTARLLLAYLLCGGLALGASQVLVLLTEEEVMREAASAPSVRPHVRTRALNLESPRIQVLSPNLSKGVIVPPLPIDLKFSSGNDAEIDPSTFKVTYGRLQFDITSRITQSVKVSKTGITVPEATLPRGNHHLNLKVNDTKGRIGETELKFIVE